MSVILVGFMGCGKSTVAKLLAEDYIDLDQLISQQIEMPIPLFFELFGEADFRQVENEVFEAAVQMGFVIATGGGIIVNEKNLEVLNYQKQVVYLKADFETLWDRISSDKENIRPLAQDKAQARALFNQRSAIYEEIANYVISVEADEPKQIAQKIMDWSKEE